MLSQTLPTMLPFVAVAGHWKDTTKTITVPDPLNGEPFISVPDTQGEELRPFVDSLKAVNKSGLHNPFKNPERCALRDA